MWAEQSSGRRWALLQLPPSTLISAPCLTRCKRAEEREAYGASLNCDRHIINLFPMAQPNIVWQGINSVENGGNSRWRKTARQRQKSSQVDQSNSMTKQYRKISI